MPIRPENKARYPKDWPEISERIRRRDGNKCKWCSVPNHELGGRDWRGIWHKAQPLGDNGLRLQWPREGESAWCYRVVNGTAVNKHLRIVRIVLTVAHLNHKPEDCSDENLAALCQRCHNLYDAPMRRAGILARERVKAAIGDLFPGERP